MNSFIKRCLFSIWNFEKTVLIFVLFIIAKHTNAQQIIPPYTITFESGYTGWNFPGVQPWELGQPSNPAFGAFAGSICVASNLSGNYSMGSYSEVTSPMFDLTASVSYYLSFWFRAMTDDDAGFNVMISMNGGTTWAILGNMNDINSINWYNDPGYAVSSGPGWSNINVWKNAIYNLSAFSGNDSIKFKFVFESLFSSAPGDYGVEFDNFSVSDNSPTDLEIQNMITEREVYPANVTMTHKIVIKNNGYFPINNATFHYSVSGGSSGFATYTGSLAPGSIDTISLLQFAIPTGEHDVTIYGNSNFDSNTNNDTIVITLHSLPLKNIPYSNDFESSLVDWYNPETIINRWELGTPSYGATNSAHSGTKCWDVNLSSAVDPSAISNMLYSPFITVTPNDTLELFFWLNYNFTTHGVALESSLDTGKTWQVVGGLNDTSGINWYTSFNPSMHSPSWGGNSLTWQQSKYKMHQSFVNGLLQFRFNYYSISISTDGISMDDFMCVKTIRDIAISTFYKPEDDRPAGVSSPVYVVIKNYGTEPVSSFQLSYSVDGGTIQNYNFTGSINPYEVDTILLVNFIVPPANYNIRSWISDTLDRNHFNDTLSVNRTVLTMFAPPYFNDFESNTFSWIGVIDRLAGSSTSNTAWSAGYSTSSPFMRKFFSGSKSFHQVSSYHTSIRTYLYTPWFDFSSMNNPTVSFYQARAMNDHQFFMEYKILDSTDWKILGTVSDPQGFNWYDTQGATDYWSGHSARWEKCIFNLDFLAHTPNVRFRFVFAVDTTISILQGACIDDFRLYERQNLDADLIVAQNIFDSTDINTNVTKFIVRNSGLQNINSLTASYAIQGGSSVDVIWNGNLFPGNITIIDMPPFSAPAGHYFFQAYINMLNDTNYVNDSLKYSTYGTNVNLIELPFFDSCENNLTWHNYSTNLLHNKWENGMPNYGSTNSVHSGNSCWDILLNHQIYHNSSYDYLVADFTLNFPSKVFEPYLSFWQNMDLLSQDLLAVQFSVYTGVYSRLTLYNNTPGLIDEWSGSSGGWVQKIVPLKDLSGLGYVYMEFLFYASQHSFVSSGVSIDDIEINYDTITTSIDKLILRHINCYPNPASSIVYVHADDMNNGSMHYKVNDLMGKLIISSTKINSNDFAVNLDNVPPGIYVISLENGKKLMTGKIIKQ